ncbi:MAG: hypothetical protein JWO80_5127 [Bryobacterales bacterium]|nr:hypothetical protein [Bryobacterales bacterium]
MIAGGLGIADARRFGFDQAGIADDLDCAFHGTDLELDIDAAHVKVGQANVVFDERLESGGLGPQDIGAFQELSDGVVTACVRCGRVAVIAVDLRDGDDNARNYGAVGIGYQTCDAGKCGLRGGIHWQRQCRRKKSENVSHEAS